MVDNSKYIKIMDDSNDALKNLNNALAGQKEQHTNFTTGVNNKIESIKRKIDTLQNLVTQAKNKVSTLSAERTQLTSNVNNMTDEEKLRFGKDDKTKIQMLSNQIAKLTADINNAAEYITTKLRVPDINLRLIEQPIDNMINKLKNDIQYVNNNRFNPFNGGKKRKSKRSKRSKTLKRYKKKGLRTNRRRR